MHNYASKKGDIIKLNSKIKVGDRFNESIVDYFLSEFYFNRVNIKCPICGEKSTFKGVTEIEPIECSSCGTIFWIDMVPLLEIKEVGNKTTKGDKK